MSGLDKTFYLTLNSVLCTNIAWVKFKLSKINFYSVGDSYLLYSPKLNNTRVYIWFKLVGNDNFWCSSIFHRKIYLSRLLQRNDGLFCKSHIKSMQKQLKI